MRIPIRTKQVIAAALALSAANVGVWAEFAPKSFYESFPMTGHHWISSLGPYNEHITRDIGGLYLALVTISAWTILRPRTEAFTMIGAGWLVFSIPHFIYHMFHLDRYGAADTIGNFVALGGTVILAALLMLPTSTSAAGDAGSGDRNVTHTATATRHRGTNRLTYWQTSLSKLRHQPLKHPEIARRHRRAPRRPTPVHHCNA
jgi:hypothetical protein